MEPPRDIYEATRVKTSSSMLHHSLRRETGSIDLPRIVRISRFERFSVGIKHDSLPKKATITTYLYPTCLLRAAYMNFKKSK